MPNQSPFEADKPTKSETRNPTSLAEICFAALKDLEPLEDLPVPPATRISPPDPAASAATASTDSKTPASTTPATTPNPAPATTPVTPASAAEIDSTAPDPYVERCMLALRDAEKAARTRGGYRSEGERVYAVEHDGKEAFKRAFPPLNGEENIRGFIACVTQAMILGIFRNDEGTKLLYAAQVAHTASKRAVAPIRSPGRPRG